jgi:gliding motility-associated-like protein
VVSNGGLDIPANSQNYLPHTYRWEANNTFYSNDQNIYKLAENIYTLSIKDSNNCQEEMTFEITQPPFVIASYRTIDDIVTTNYPIVNLYDNSQGNVIEWQWELNNVLLANSQDVMNIDLTSDLDSSGIKYYDLKLVVTDEFMCKDSIYGRLAIKEEHTLFVPNGFTPDFDGNNDAFKIFHHAMKTETFSMVVYDRWGSLVFESDNPDISWDGTNMKTGNLLVAGTYSYILSYQDFESRIYDHTNCENCSGTITLVR